MIIELIDKMTVRAFVSDKEMNCAETGDRRKTVKNMLCRIFGELGNEFFPKKYNEIIVNVTRGSLGTELVIYKRRKTGMRENYPIIYRYNTVSELQSGVANTIYPKIYLIRKSDLLIYSDKYYLLLYPMCIPNCRLFGKISEYADFVGKGQFAAEFLMEHGKPVCIGNAVEKLNF